MGFPTSFASYREQERGETANHFEVTAAAEKDLCSSDSGYDSHFPAMHGLQQITTERSGSFSVYLQTSVAAWLEASKQYFRLQSCRSSDLVRANNSDASAPLLNGPAQLVVTHLSNSIWK